MKICIIPDIHHRTDEADRAITEAQADRVVFLGDYFDDFGDKPQDARRTARWIRRRMDAHPEDVWLFGNHDLPYAFGGHLYPCPGWTPQKHQAVGEILRPEHWRRFVLHSWEQDWLLSHAGITSWLFPIGKNDDPQFVVDERCRLALERSWRGENDPVLSAVGRSRGGRCESGGIVWQCWSEFNPIPGVNQIIGHTPTAEPRVRYRPLKEKLLSGRLYVRVEDEDTKLVSENHCLDTHSQHYGVLEEGLLAVHPAPKLISEFQHAKTT